MKKLIIFSLAILTTLGSAFAGNPERAGQAGATQLLINSWGRSSGFGGINLGAVNGIESIMTNPAGISTTRRTELVFSHTRYLADININSFGLSQALKSAGVIGIYFTSYDLGEFIRTTVDNPSGDLGNFSPTYLNMGLTYGKKFTDHIYVGATLKAVHESIFDASANGVAFDAGVQYRTNLGREDSLHSDRLKLGVSLRNIGSTMRFGGDGLTFRANRDPDFTSLAARPTSEFEMPSVLSLGVSYDFYFGADNRFTALGAFVSNAFSHDQIGVGFEYGFKDYLMLRYGFLYEKDIFDINKRITTWTGHSAGLTVEVPFKTGDNKISSFGLDYSYRTTDIFNGVHSIGVRIDL